MAFGGTEESLTRTVLGVPARGTPGTDAPFDRTTGEGWVRETPSPDYADALSKGFGVTLLVAETTGAVSRPLDDLLRRLGKVASLPGTVDCTPYGESRASPQGFYRHYLAAHSQAVVHADALTLLDKASSLCYFFGRNE